jgi:DNA-directed RNA polymerase beta subunit
MLVTHTVKFMNRSYSATRSCIPFLEKNQVADSISFCNSVGYEVIPYQIARVPRMETFSTLNRGDRPLSRTKTIANLDCIFGQNAVVALMSGYSSSSLSINKSPIQRGLFRKTQYYTYVFPTKNKIDSSAQKIDEYDYNNLDLSGVIDKGAYIHDKSVLVHTNSPFLPYCGHVGRVDNVCVGKKNIKIQISSLHSIELGDVLMSIAGKDAIVGSIVDENDMPFDDRGSRPDIIINPDQISCA